MGLHASSPNTAHWLRYRATHSDSWGTPFFFPIHNRAHKYVQTLFVVLSIQWHTANSTFGCSLARTQPVEAHVNGSDDAESDVDDVASTLRAAHQAQRAIETNRTLKKKNRRGGALSTQHGKGEGRGGRRRGGGPRSGG
jgi:hypothetical protein